MVDVQLCRRPSGHKCLLQLNVDGLYLLLSCLRLVSLHFLAYSPSVYRRFLEPGYRVLVTYTSPKRVLRHLVYSAPSLSLIFVLPPCMVYVVLASLAPET